jgi:hypothetical protein
MISSSELWQPLTDELAHWAHTGRVATLWWRDDDAIAPTPALDRMLALLNRHRVPLGLAVIPARATAALADRLRGESLVAVLPHGFAHANHARPGERAAEFGAQRTVAVRVAEVIDGWARLQGFAGLVPLFVPPWNRYDLDLCTGLTGQQIRAISAFGARKQLSPPLVECNCHVDIITWRTTRGFAGTGKTVSKLTEHLRARRTGELPADEVTGLLTHHLDHDEACWTFLAELSARLGGHPAVRWVSPRDLITAAGRP